MWKSATLIAFALVAITSTASAQSTNEGLFKTGLCVLIHDNGKNPIWSDQHYGKPPQISDNSNWYIFNAGSKKKTYNITITKGNGDIEQHDISLGSFKNWQRFVEVDRIKVTESDLASYKRRDCEKFYNEDHHTWYDNAGKYTALALPWLITSFLGVGGE